LIFLLISSLFLTGCFFSDSKDKDHISEMKGEVFGSYYVIKYRGELDKVKFNDELLLFFQEFNNEFSTYQKTSIVSQFNDAIAFQRLKISSRFIEMLEVLKRLYESTQGAFDPTLGPVIKLWGFGGGSTKKVPSEIELKEALGKVGFHYIQWDTKRQEVWKTKDGVILDFNAFAPGWAADLIGELLSRFKIENYLIDISGELVAKGEKFPGVNWIVGIEKPTSTQGSGVQIAVKLNNASIATSGSYRQFFDKNGKKLSHIINPKTGKPVEHDICSATVIGENGFQTDAWSTALMVLGPQGLDMADAAGLKVFLLEKKSSEEIKEIISPRMKLYLEKHSI
jgi:thiamine biosynthesis lipoprotein